MQESKSQQTKSQLPMASSETPQTPTNISPSHSKDQKQQTSVQQPDPKAHVSDTTVQSTHSPTKFKPSATAAASTLPTPELPQPLPSSVQHLGTDAQAEPIERDGPPIKQTSVGSHASPTVTAKPASVQGIGICISYSRPIRWRTGNYSFVLFVQVLNQLLIVNHSVCCVKTLPMLSSCHVATLACAMNVLIQE